MASKIVLLENAVYGRRYEAAVGGLLEILAEIGSDQGEFVQWATFATEERRIVSACTRLASAITTLLTDPDFPLSRSEFTQLAFHVVNIAQIFYLSGFETTDHLIAVLKARSRHSAEGVIRFAEKSDARKFLLSFSPYSRAIQYFFNALRQDPEGLQLVLLSLVHTHVAATELAHENRHRLLDALRLLEEVVPTDLSMRRLTHAWGLCSYATSKDKHAVKDVLNRMVRNWLAAKKIEVPPVRALGPRKERPTLLVCCEVFRYRHAVYRCYLHFIRQLRRSFEVILLTAEEDATEEHADWCDRLITFPNDRLEIPAIIDSIRSVDPDMIYFPSVGLRPWGIVLSNLRLAPIQVATLGHPATTRSPHIDTVVLGKEILGEPDCFTEKLVLLESPGNVYTHPYEPDRTEPTVRTDLGGQPRIAICGTSMKLNAEFLRTCRRIAEGSDHGLEFHFFPNEVGIRYLMVRAQMREVLPDSEVHVHPRSDYPGYIEGLDRCDVCLSPFPFGGENSTIDALRRAKPLVTLESPEPHGRLDSRIMRLANLPQWLITHDEQEYIQAALRLLGDDELRGQISQALIDVDLAGRLEEEQQIYKTDFVDTVRWIYDNHERMQQSDRQVWSLSKDGPV